MPDPTPIDPNILLPGDQAGFLKSDIDRATEAEQNTDQHILDEAQLVVEKFNGVGDIRQYLDTNFEQKLKAREEFGTRWYKFSSEELAPGTEMRYHFSERDTLLLVRKECEALCRHALSAGADNILFLDRSARGYGYIVHETLPIFRLEYAKIRGVNPKDIKVPEIHFANPRNGEIPDSEEIRAIIDDKKTIVFDESTNQSYGIQDSNPVELSPAQQYDYFDMTNDDMTALDSIAYILSSKSEVNDDDSASHLIGGEQVIYDSLRYHECVERLSNYDEDKFKEVSQKLDYGKWLQREHPNMLENIAKIKKMEESGEKLLRYTDGAFIKERRLRMKKSQMAIYDPKVMETLEEHNTTRYIIAKKLLELAPLSRLETHVGLSGTAGGQLTRLINQAGNYFHIVDDKEGSSFATRGNEATPEKMEKLRQLQKMIAKLIIEDVTKVSFPELSEVIK